MCQHSASTLSWVHEYRISLVVCLVDCSSLNLFSTSFQKNPIFTNLKKRFEHIELSAKLLDYFLPSNKSNINQSTVLPCSFQSNGTFGPCSQRYVASNMPVGPIYPQTPLGAPGARVLQLFNCPGFFFTLLFHFPPPFFSRCAITSPVIT